MRFKARLVAKGFSQTYMTNYFETFAPIAKIDSIRVMISTAAAEDLEMVQFDICTAYLYAPLLEEAYMALPEGFEEVFNQRFLDSREKVCKIRKGLYSLKQSARGWNTTFSEFLKKYDLIQSEEDPCVFCSTSTPHVILALWVDDEFAICKRERLFEQYDSLP